MQPFYFLINETMGRPKKYQTEEERKAAMKEWKKRWEEKNNDKVKEYKKRWREANPDYFKQYYQENREEKLEYKKQYRNTPIGRAVHLVDTYQQNDKKYNRGECTLTGQWVVDNIFSKPCHYCGKEGWEVIGCDRIDNSKPHTPDNVVPCCEECNVKRGTMNYEEFLISLSGINKSVS